MKIKPRAHPNRVLIGPATSKHTHDPKSPGDTKIKNMPSQDTCDGRTHNGKTPYDEKKELFTKCTTTDKPITPGTPFHNAFTKITASTPVANREHINAVGESKNTRNANVGDSPNIIRANASSSQTNTSEHVANINVGNVKNIITVNVQGSQNIININACGQLNIININARDSSDGNNVGKGDFAAPKPVSMSTTLRLCRRTNKVGNTLPISNNKVDQYLYTLNTYSAKCDQYKEREVDSNQHLLCAKLTRDKHVENLTSGMEVDRFDGLKHKCPVEYRYDQCDVGCRGARTRILDDINPEESLMLSCASGDIPSEMSKISKSCSLNDHSPPEPISTRHSSKQLHPTGTSKAKQLHSNKTLQSKRLMETRSTLLDRKRRTTEPDVANTCHRKTYSEWLSQKKDEFRRSSLQSSCLHFESQSSHSLETLQSGKTFDEWKREKDKIENERKVERRASGKQTNKGTRISEERKEMTNKKYNEWLIKKHENELREEEELTVQMRRKWSTKGNIY